MSPSAFLPPVYEPEPYTFTGLLLRELPHLCQYYLADVAQLLPPRVLTPNAIKDERHRLVLSLFRNLEGTSMSLIEKRYDAARDQDLNLSPAVTAEKNAARLREILYVLLPERQRLLDEFLLKFDALLWLDVEGREDYNAEDWQIYRDSLVSQVLEIVDRRLIELDESVGRAMAQQCVEPPDSTRTNRCQRYSNYPNAPKSITACSPKVAPYRENPGFKADWRRTAGDHDQPWRNARPFVTVQA